MAWLREYYDRAILVALLLALGLSGTWLAVVIRDRVERLRELDRPVTARPNQGFADVDFSVWTNALAQLADPMYVSSTNSRVFTSELRVFCGQCGKWIEYAALKCPFCEAEQPPIDPRVEADSDKDGVPDSWEEKFGLDSYNPDDVRLDHDGDGFSSLEEHRAGTDPRDPASTPPVFAKLRLRRILTQSFKLRFVSIQRLSETEERYQLNARTLERTYFPKIGDIVEGYRVESYDKAADTLVLRKDDTVKRLQRGKVIDDDQLIVQFVFLLDGTTPTARVGEMIEVRGQRARIAEVSRDRSSVRIVLEDRDRSYDVVAPTAEEEAGLKLRLSAPLGGPTETPAPLLPGLAPAPAAPAPTPRPPAGPGAFQ